MTADNDLPHSETALSRLTLTVMNICGGYQLLTGVERGPHFLHWHTQSVIWVGGIGIVMSKYE